MQLTHAFRIQPKEVVAFVGGGGKTAAMFRLADELAASGRRVITTTTTRIFAAQIKLAPYHIKSPHAPSAEDRGIFDSIARGEGGFDSMAARELVDQVRVALASHPHTLVIGETNEEGKAFGVPVELVDELIDQGGADAVIYEADGSRMRPFKAPASHEPVLTARTTLLAPVVGIGALGDPLDDVHVHRAEIVAGLAGARIGDPVTPEMVACVLAHPQGGLKSKPAAARAIVLINAVENADQLTAARQIARMLLESSDVEGVAIGAVKNETQPIRQVHRRVAAIITAAGPGTRMEGRIKQLLPWRGKTLIENAIDIAARSEADEIILVLGAHADEIRKVVHEPRARVVVNPDWEEGHASSIRAGLAAISRTMDAAIFINADQPLLTPETVNAIIQRYRETDAEIVAPTYAGKRGSPVLFQRVHFGELGLLRGDEGGRKVLGKHAERVERVSFDDARLGVDVDTMEEYEAVVSEQ